jgi:colicin import membrane protein
MSYAIGLRLAQDQSFKFITCAVVALHLLFIAFVTTQTFETAPLKPVQKLIVKTITLNEGRVSVPRDVAPAPIVEPPAPVLAEPEPEPIAEVEEEAPPIPEPKVEKVVPKAKPAPKPKPVKKVIPKKTVPVKKPVAKKKEAVKKPAPKKATPAKKPAAAVDPKAAAIKAKQRELVAQAQASLAKVGKATPALKGVASASNAPAKINSLSVDAVGDDLALNVREIGYRNELASRLRTLLTLPEHGDVKIKLKLERSGKFLSVSIVHAQNSANRKYIEKSLPALTFPSFGSNFSGHLDYTFLITLSNDL